MLDRGLAQPVHMLCSLVLCALAAGAPALVRAATPTITVAPAVVNVDGLLTVTAAVPGLVNPAPGGSPSPARDGRSALDSRGPQGSPPLRAFAERVSAVTSPIRSVAGHMPSRRRGESRRPGRARFMGNTVMRPLSSATSTVHIG